MLIRRLLHNKLSILSECGELVSDSGDLTVDVSKVLLELEGLHRPVLDLSLCAAYPKLNLLNVNLR